ncbi:ABC transporter substrate-binding protein [Roseomonas sp. BN140053]|uniref:ABC transporter substrate-binding protein n=1 Tax=Roseomonas sp. BN140053 TaxID=3391898 RepID=UPI0039E73530
MSPSRVAALLTLALGGIAAVAAPARADRNLFVVDLPTDPASLDPHLQWDPDSYTVYRNLFDNLLTRDASGAIVPQVATSWRYDSDTQISFELRDDIRFSDGTPLTADDVAYSIRRITDPAFRSPQLSQFDQITGAEVVGPRTVRITTRSAYPVLLSQLTKLSIVPRAAAERLGASFNAQPVGSGPYRLTARTQGVRVELAANPSYWRGAPPFPRVEMRPVPDESTRIADVRTGRADIARILSTDNADGLRNDRQVQVLWAPTERVSLLMLNTQDGPTRDPRVREAIAHAVDRDTIIEALLRGYARPVNAPLTPASFGFADAPAYGFDIARARALLREAGVAPGTKVSFLTSPVFDQRVVQALQQMLGEVGLDAQLNTVELANYLRLRQGRPDEAGQVSFFRWSCGCQDADGTLFPLFHSSSQWAKYSNPAVDAALQAGRNTLDEGARRTAYRTALDALHRDIPAVPLFQDVTMHVANRHVRFQPTANESFLLMDVGWTE